MGAADKEVLALPGFREALDRDMGEALPQGGHGPAHDLTLEARPWGVPFERIRVPIEIWHGDDDQVVSSQQSRVLARTLSLVAEHYVPGEGHFSLFARHAEEVMRSLVGS